jgi:predicted metalloprotease with PDZ domain
MVARILGPLLALLAMTHATSALAQTAVEPIRYTLSFPAPQTHYVEVSAEVPTGGRGDVELMMAVWTPGSYLVREYSRHVEAVTATGPDGRTRAIEKSDKNRWRVTTGGARTVTVKYRVYGREMSVRTNWIDAGFALINGAPTFMTLPDGVARPHEVVINLAQGWRRSLTGLPEMSGGDHRYRARDYDTLVDSPFLLGNPTVHEFTIDGKKHYLANEGEGSVFDGAKAATDLEVVVREHRRFWGQLPYDKYVFVNILLGNEPGGGLEHQNSTVLMTGRFTTRTRRAYLAWLELASHEFFHAWNIKRLRPVELGPFDYENEVHTKSLWIAEGVTDYYGELLVHRAGLSTGDEYLDNLSSHIETVQTAPGRLLQSAELASFDAWIKYYRPDENSANVSISYYEKGLVLAFVLDAKIRTVTRGVRSLDDVMRAAYEKYAGTRGFSPAEFQAVAEQVAGTRLESFWATAVEGTAELDYTEALKAYGLRFRAATPSNRAFLGATTRNDNGRLVVSQVRRGTPAYEAGLNVDDEILAIDDLRVRADQLPTRLDQYKPADKVTLLIARREQLNRLDVRLGSEPPREWRLEIDANATPEQVRQRDRWLSGNGSA